MLVLGKLFCGSGLFHVLKRYIILWSYDSTCPALNFSSVLTEKNIHFSKLIHTWRVFFSRGIKDSITYSFKHDCLWFPNCSIFPLRIHKNFQVIYSWSDCTHVIWGRNSALKSHSTRHIMNTNVSNPSSIWKEISVTYEGKSICCLTRGGLCISKPGV